MGIGDIIKQKDYDTYKKLTKMGKEPKREKKKDIKLGDSVENLMKAHVYKRVGRRIKQIK